MSAACTATRRDGRPCTAPVLGDGRQCWAHDPALAAKRAETRRKGGHNRSNAARLSKIMPARLAPVWEQLETALAETHRGDLDPKAAGAMASIARAMVAVLQAGELEARVRELEERTP